MTHRLTKPQKMGFAVRRIRSKRSRHPMHYLSKPVTFWIAVFSLFAFVSGNMLGHEGLYVFWASMWAQYDDSLITYQGTVAPIPLIPDPIAWAKYGGDQRYNTYAQAPKDILIPYPSYRPVSQIPATDLVAKREYSADLGGGYSTDIGSHNGIDMAAPKGTPVVAIMNAFVAKVANDPAGFGNYVMLRAPNSPSIKNPGQTATYFVIYGHLDTTTVTVGEVVKKGQLIGTVGKTGDATGYHLHFQMEDDSAPTHPYWPFTNADARAAGLSFNQAIDSGLNRDNIAKYMENPMLYVQANPAAVNTTVVKASSSAVSSARPMTATELAAARRAQRTAQAALQVALANRTVVATAAGAVASSSSSAAAVSVSSEASAVASSAVSSAPAVNQPAAYASIDIQAPYQYTDGTPQKIRISLVDDRGDPVRNPLLSGTLHLRTTYGKATFTPSELTAKDFVNGVATVNVRPIPKQTIVVEVVSLSDGGLKTTEASPIRYAGK